jgi:uncharacterized protein YdeI (YjbR/CyaY-like superfamily)
VEPTFFATPEEFRARLERQAREGGELLVGFHKVGTGLPSITWPEAVDEALCVGWIDGVRRRIDESAYSIRFTPRKPGSNWSANNIERVAALTAQGRMRPAGLAAFAARSEARSRVYSYERTEPPALSSEAEALFRAEPGAWDFFSAQAPWYRRTALHWVTGAVREATRERRLAQLIADSAAGRRLAHLTRS